MVSTAWQTGGARLIRWVRGNRLISLFIVVLLIGLGLIAANIWSVAGKPSAENRGPAPVGASSSPTLVASPSLAASPSVGSPSPSRPPSRTPAAGGWPGANNTGVPAGTVLGTYGGCSGDHTLITTANTVIDSKRVNCDVVIRATGVVIKNSLINGMVSTDENQPGSFTITDSEVTAGMGTKNIIARRVNVHGGPGPDVYCYTNCDIRDSWLHSPSYGNNPQAHLGAFLANDNGPDGSTTNVTLIHNSIHCDTAPNPPDGGCSGDVNLFGDFGPITHVTIDGNWLGGSTGISYCFYGGEGPQKNFPHADHVVFQNNVFQKGVTGHCGDYGPVTGFNVNGPGNVWSNNTYDNGASVPAED